MIEFIQVDKIIFIFKKRREKSEMFGMPRLMIQNFKAFYKKKK